MGWLFVAVVAVGWAFAGFQNSGLQPEVSGVLGLAFASTLVAVWLHGRSSGRARAFAAAYAKAEARAAASAMAGATASNQVQIVLADGARARSSELSGLDQAEWIGASVPLLEQEVSENLADDLRESLDRAEVVD